MKVTYNWLKDFVDIRISAQKLAEKLTMAGFEVTALEKKDADFVFELEITPNRPDVLSIIGIAREVAAITGKKLKIDPRSSILDPRARIEERRRQKAGCRQRRQASRIKGFNLDVNIENKKDCSVYTARVIKGVRVKPSPDWLKRRLELVGLRSVNNIVDITNYILIETGQPLHAFDLDRLAGQPVGHTSILPLGITIRKAADKEGIITIDGEQRTLDSEILVIAAGRIQGKQARRHQGVPKAIAGIMGGQGCEVSDKTKDILLEAAVFDPGLIRQASRKLNISSESSYRFERGIDIKGLEFASTRAAELILKIAGGKLILNKATLPKVKDRVIVLKSDEVKRILGRDYSLEKIRRIFVSLCFSVTRQRERSLKLKVPSFRMDISQSVDLIEEVARISGYENIPVKLPRIVPQDAGLPFAWRTKKIVRDILVSQGINEAVTYSLISKNTTAQFGYPDSRLATVANPLTSQQEVLRPSLIPALVSCIGYNLNQKQKDIQIFEIGNIFRLNHEQLSLGLAYSGKGFNLLHIKGALEVLFERLGITDFEFIKTKLQHSCFQEELFLSVIVNPAVSYSNPDSLCKRDGGNKKIFAALGMIKPDILVKLDIKECIFAAELDLETLFTEAQKAHKRYIPIPLYPEITRDISIILKQNIPVGDVLKRIKADKIPYLVELNLKDCYSGRQIPAGYKGLTLSCVYRASDHTLTAQEIDTVHQRVLDVLKTGFSARQR